MSTPNSNTDDSTLLDIPAGAITSKVHTGTLPIASGMMPDASKYYVSNFVDSTISVVDMTAPQHVTKTIDLLENYDPISGRSAGRSAVCRSRPRSSRPASTWCRRTR